jgi:dUTP pyrophosphatase
VCCAAGTGATGAGAGAGLLIVCRAGVIGSATELRADEQHSQAELGEMRTTWNAHGALPFKRRAERQSAKTHRDSSEFTAQLSQTAPGLSDASSGALRLLRDHSQYATVVQLPLLARRARRMHAGVNPRLKVQLLREGAQAPSYASAGAAGLDLCAAIERSIVLAPGQRVAVPTGIAIALPRDHEGQVRPRSGLARKYGISMVNTPGTIDEDYRGEVQVLLINLGQEPYTIQPGDRVAQLVVAPITRVRVEVANTLDSTERGEGGFGSTGR